MENEKDIYIPREGELVRFVRRSHTSTRKWGKAGEYYLVTGATLSYTRTGAVCWFAGTPEDIVCIVAPTDPPAFLPDCDLPCIGHPQVNLKGAKWDQEVKAYILNGMQSLRYPLNVVPWGLVNEALEASQQPRQEAQLHEAGTDPCPDCKRERGHSLACPRFWDWVSPVRTPTSADVAAMEMRLSWIKSEEAKEKAQERKGVDQAWLAARRAAYHQAPDLDLNQYYFDRGLGLPAPTVEDYLAQRAAALDLAIEQAKKQGPAYQYPHWPEHCMNPNYED